MPSNAPYKMRAKSSSPSPRLNAASINSLSANARRDFPTSLDQADATRLLEHWWFWLRGEQRPPGGGWRIWPFLGGRGAGKTLAGAHWIADGIRHERMRRVGVIGATPQRCPRGDDRRGIRPAEALR